MDRLPPEITGEILRMVCDTSDRQGRCSHAIVSRGWQAFVERATFAKLYLTQSRLEEAQADGILTPARQSYIRCIDFFALIPSHYDRDNTTIDPQESSRIVFEAVDKLLNAMPNGILRCADPPPYWESRPSFVKLPHDVHLRLPEVPRVTKFTHGIDVWSSPFRLTPGACCGIANRFPNLKAIHWFFLHGPPENDIPSQLLWRHDFVTGIPLIPESVREASICEELIPERLVGLTSGQTLDPLSLALRGFIKQLESLVVRATVGKEIFDNPDFNGDCRDSPWPRLREITLVIADRTPQGHGFFDKRMSTTNAGEHPLDKVQVCQLSPYGEIYWIALARAAAHMPRLKRMDVRWYTSPYLTYSVEPDSSGASLKLSNLNQFNIRGALQEAWWETARVHIQEGAGFRFMAEERGKELHFTSFRDGRRFLNKRTVPRRKLSEWTRTKV
ncbi:hypothetical protein PG996_006932 [Apiospora saccharicola]|uniref:F-box domain-containing protein n=1 Tax=Apiospora saccharicola TaxID=335842 RepID=A0ABR1VC48_9PEZI